MLDNRQICTFYLDGHFFGVDVENVQEVLRYQDMTPVPLAPSVVRGLINLRGEIVTAIDIRRRLGLPERGPDEMPLNVVLQTKDGPVSLLVDEIGDVLEIDEQTFETPPETLTGASRELLHGVYKLEDKLLLVLDTGKAVDFDPAADNELEAAR